MIAQEVVLMEKIKHYDDASVESNLCNTENKYKI